MEIYAETAGSYIPEFIKQQVTMLAGERLFNDPEAKRDAPERKRHKIKKPALKRVFSELKYKPIDGMGEGADITSCPL